MHTLETGWLALVAGGEKASVILLDKRRGLSWGLRVDRRGYTMEGGVTPAQRRCCDHIKRGD